LLLLRLVLVAFAEVVVLEHWVLKALGLLLLE